MSLDGSILLRLVVVIVLAIAVRQLVLHFGRKAMGKPGDAERASRDGGASKNQRGGGPRRKHRR